MTARSSRARPHEPQAGFARRLALALIAVLVAAGGGLWWFVLRDDAPPPAALGDCAPPGDGTSPPTADGTWTIRPGAADTGFVGYRVDERFGGETLTKTATGRTGDIEGSLVVDGATVRDTTVVAQLDTLRSDRTARDSALRTKGLETSRFPEARFTLTEPIALAADPSRGASIDAVATGTLELHGQQRAVRVPIEACWTGPTIQLSGSAPIVLADFGIDQIQTPIVDIADHGELEFELIFTPS